MILRILEKTRERKQMNDGFMMMQSKKESAQRTKMHKTNHMTNECNSVDEREEINHLNIYALTLEENKKKT